MFLKDTTYFTAKIFKVLKTSLSKLLKNIIDLVSLIERIISTSIKIKLKKLLTNLKDLQHI